MRGATTYRSDPASASNYGIRTSIHSSSEANGPIMKCYYYYYYLLLLDNRWHSLITMYYR